MASIGHLRIPVRLIVGNVDSEIGELNLDMIANLIPDEPCAVAISTQAGDLRPHLIALLRATADHIEQGVNDAPARS